MLNIPTVAVGAIAAALIAALVSLLGLIISKEQKTSEFRQAWVDALREDLSNYLTQINAICDGVSVKYESIEKKVEVLTPIYRELNKATFSIALRINPEEPLARSILTSMGHLHKLTGDHSTIAPDKIRPIERELLHAAQQLLKAEWKRVKNGETTFVVAKFTALGVVLVSIILGCWQLTHHINSSPAKPPAASSATPQTGQTVTPRPKNGAPASGPTSGNSKRQTSP